ncbi:hypothetical protein ABZZ16_35240, partial [Streptomyces sp. NPDC006386]|uniref:hypothetical protein n=1 Tax=Streptomyces sp. NPDC006386 TaxID=3156762 RepID=UPI0033AF0533
MRTSAKTPGDENRRRQPSFFGSVPRAACWWPARVRDDRACACAASGDSASPFVKASANTAAPSAAVAAAVVRSTSSRSAAGSGGETHYVTLTDILGAEDAF